MLSRVLASTAVAVRLLGEECLPLGRASSWSGLGHGADWDRWGIVVVGIWWYFYYNISIAGPQPSRLAYLSLSSSPDGPLLCTVTTRDDDLSSCEPRDPFQVTTTDEAAPSPTISTNIHPSCRAGAFFSFGTGPTSTGLILSLSPRCRHQLPAWQLPKFQNYGTERPVRIVPYHTIPTIPTVPTVPTVSVDAFLALCRVSTKTTW